MTMFQSTKRFTTHFTFSMLALAAGSACSTKRPAPVHDFLVCDSGPDGKPMCGAGERTAAFEHWSREALERPGSTFSIWVSGRDHGSARPYFSACVPTGSWGADVRGAQAAFLNTARARLSRPALAPTDSRLPSSCASQADSGQQCVQIGRKGGAPGPCESAAASVPLYTAVICDASDSTTGHACDTARLELAFDRWLERTRAASGSAFVIYVAGRERDDTRRVFSFRPMGNGAAKRLASALGARKEIAALTPDANKPGSAIAEAISVAASGMPPAPAARSLVVLSDLRQYTRGRWNFERRPLPAKRFVAELERNKLLPDLAGVPVVACGLHARRGKHAPRYSARQAARVRAAWQAVFARSRAASVKIAGDCEAVLGPARVAMR